MTPTFKPMMAREIIITMTCASDDSVDIMAISIFSEL